MQGTCAPSIKGRVMRVSRLDACGNYTETDPSAVVVSSGFVKIDVKPEYEAGTEITKKNANGDLCVSEKSRPVLKRMAVDIEFCQVQPVLYNLLLPSTLLTSGTPATGIGMTFGEAQADQNFALEVWSEAAGTSVCVGEQQQFIRWVFPWLYHGQLGDFAVENNDLSFKMAAETHRAGGDFQAGGISGDVLAPYDHFGFAFTTAAPPNPGCASTASPS